jgi:hypothetical protein
MLYYRQMKTTVEIPDALFREFKEYAARHGIPMREVLERGLRLVLSGAPPAGRRFRLKTITTQGEGLACGEDWSTIRSLIYEGHGG